MKTLKFLLIPLFALLASCTIDVPVQGGGQSMRPIPPAYEEGFNPGRAYRPPVQYGGRQQGYYGNNQGPTQYGGGYRGPTQYGGGNSPTYYGGTGPGYYNNGPNGAGQTIYHGSQARHVYGSGTQYYAP